MRKLLFILLLAAFAIPLKAQVVLYKQGHTQLTYYSTYRANTEHDTLVAVIRPMQTAVPPCEPVCGNTYYLVTDTNGNQWKPACTSLLNVCQFWYALDAKPGFNAVGVLASRGDNGGDFSFDVIIAEYPPAIALDAYSQNEYWNGGGDDEPNASVVTTASNDLLIFWSAQSLNKPPVSLTADYPFTLIDDDGYLALADRTAPSPGTYLASGHYSGYCLWRAGVAAFKLK
jgi:hypothetical protein